MYLSAVEIRKTIANVSSDTLRKWADRKLIRVKRRDGVGKRWYDADDVRKLFGDSTTSCETSASSTFKEEDDKKTKKIAYARVSSSKQKEDLQRQVSALQQAYPTHTIVTDIGSGLNFRRQGFRSILDKCMRGVVSEVAMLHRDRLCRFAFELVEDILSQHGVKIVVYDQSKSNERSSEQELAEDLLSIVTVFTARYHGKRSHQNILSKSGPGKEGTEKMDCKSKASTGSGISETVPRKKARKRQKTGNVPIERGQEV
jgi:predicted site-specific integrase-resolvase